MSLAEHTAILGALLAAKSVKCWQAQAVLVAAMQPAPMNACSGERGRGLSALAKASLSASFAHFGVQGSLLSHLKKQKTPHYHSSRPLIIFLASKKSLRVQEFMR